MELSAGVIVFRKESNKTLYLLLHYGNRQTPDDVGHWDFPKGHVEKGEHMQETALRELKEETGITDVTLLDNFKETISYFFKKDGQPISKKVIFFLAETKQQQVKLSFEHIGFQWLPYEEALQQATFKNAKQVLEKANKFLAT